MIAGNWKTFAQIISHLQICSLLIEYLYLAFKMLEVIQMFSIFVNCFVERMAKDINACISSFRCSTSVTIQPDLDIIAGEVINNVVDY